MEPQVVVEGKVPVKTKSLDCYRRISDEGSAGNKIRQLTYTSSQGQFLPGYMPGTKYLGMSDYNDILAPGWPFILGYSDENFFDKAVTNGWLIN